MFSLAMASPAGVSRPQWSCQWNLSVERAGRGANGFSWLRGGTVDSTTP